MKAWLRRNQEELTIYAIGIAFVLIDATWTI